MKKVLLMLVVAAAAGYGILSYHFILFDDSLKILKKSAVRYENTFVDGRGGKKIGLLVKPDLLEAGIKDILSQVDNAIEGSGEKQ